MDQNYTFSSDGSLRRHKVLDTGETVMFAAKDVRRERTGLHALVAIIRAETILASDVFNVGRDPDRGRLANSAHRMLGAELGAIYPATVLKHDLDLFCIGLAKAWEERFAVEDLHGEHDLGPVGYTLMPYILDEGGTILFAPPGQGKSFVTLLMAQSINQAAAIDDEHRIWYVPRQEPVLYVNLERPGRSMRRRMTGINQALGLPANTPLPFLNARGRSLRDVAGTIRKAKRDRGIRVGFLDSISRAGFGTLVEDQTANGIIDVLNELFPTWFAIGHTARGNGDHVYGSIHFDAGEDIGVKLASETRGPILAIVLEMIKANDTAKAEKQVIELEFGEFGLASAGRGSLDNYPRLGAGGDLLREEQVRQYVGQHGAHTATEIAKVLGIPRPDVWNILQGKDFVALPKQGRGVPYDLVRTTQTANGSPYWAKD